MYDHYDALIFDMDGTLVDSGQLHEFAWSETLNKYGIPIDRAFMRSLAGVPTKGTIEILLAKFNLTVAATLEEMNNFKEAWVHDNMHRFVKPTALIEVAKKLPRHKTHGDWHGCLHARSHHYFRIVWFG